MSSNVVISLIFNDLTLVFQFSSVQSLIVKLIGLVALDLSMESVICSSLLFVNISESQFHSILTE